ncbi:MAG: hypothetical protein KIS94_05080 [Chitinophagales bacterium]|nr:hypothetical protein [Chitinophagales bacterium]
MDFLVKTAAADVAFVNWAGDRSRLYFSVLGAMILALTVFTFVAFFHFTEVIEFSMYARLIAAGFCSFIVWNLYRLVFATTSHDIRYDYEFRAFPPVTVRNVDVLRIVFFVFIGFIVANGILIWTLHFEIEEILQQINAGKFDDDSLVMVTLNLTNKLVDKYQADSMLHRIQIVQLLTGWKYYVFILIVSLLFCAPVLIRLFLDDIRNGAYERSRIINERHIVQSHYNFTRDYSVDVLKEVFKVNHVWFERYYDPPFNLHPKISIIEELDEEGKKFVTGRTETEHCDFCGAAPNGNFMQVLDDNRVRCYACSVDAVDSLMMLNDLYLKAHQFMIDIGYPVTRNFPLRIAKANEIAECLDEKFIPTPGFDERALGLAVRRGDEQFILVERGHRKPTMYAILAHELTHIWQFNNLNYDLMKQQHGILLIEGQAMWTQLKALKHQKAVVEYENLEVWLTYDESEYGKGYRYLLAYLKEHKQKDPFKLLLSEYPKMHA